MSFKPSIEIGEVIKNNKIVEIFKCGNMGGMRRSKSTNTLVIITDHNKMYDDKWEGDVLHYTGMGKIGDQELYYMQNKTLTQSKTNGVGLHIFEVIKPKNYIYRGEGVLCDKPYPAKQEDDDGKMRRVWMFPIRLLTE